MRARMFKSQFAALVKSGAKRQTIRPIPKRMPKVGDKESWRQWQAQPYRSLQIELAQVEITSVEPISLDLGMRTWPEVREIAIADGFISATQMLEWFQAIHGLPFEGILIKAKTL